MKRLSVFPQSFKFTTLPEVIRLFLRDGYLKCPEWAGLRDFSIAQMLACDFEQAGDVEEFSMFSKPFTVPVRNGEVTLVYKAYFEGGILQ